MITKSSIDIAKAKGEAYKKMGKPARLHIPSWIKAAKAVYQQGGK